MQGIWDALTEMKKRNLIIIGVLISIALIILIVFVMSYRTITVVSGKQFVDRFPKIARPGQEVTITTAVVSDGEIYVNGVDGDYIRPGVYVFTMPDRNVKIKVNVTAYADGA